MARRQYAGGAAAATITGAIASSGGGTVTIDNTAGWPDGAIGKFHVVIDAGTSAEEKILMDLRSGSSLQFSSGGRGADGTVSTSHSTGAPIWICYTALDADEANAHLNTQNPAHTAAFIYFAPAGTISATNVQAAVQALDSTDSNLDTRIDTAEATLNVIQQDNWVTQARLADNSVGTTELVDGSVTSAKIANGGIAGVDLAPGAVGDSALGSGTATWAPTVSQGATTDISKTVVEARYSLVGGLCLFWFDINIAGAGTAGATLCVSLPFPPQGHSATAAIGAGFVFDASDVPSQRRATGNLEIEGNKLCFSVASAVGGGQWGVYNSAAVASGDVVRGSGCYRWA